MCIPFDYKSVPLEPGTCALIEANAGTGKTYNIQNLYVRLLIEKKLEPSQILVVTFTEAATSELGDRIRKSIAAAYAGLDPTSEDALRLRLAMASFDEAAIFTIHSFCKRALERHAFSSRVPFDSTLQSSTDELLRETICDFIFRWQHDRNTACPVPAAGLTLYAKTLLRRPGTTLSISEDDKECFDALAAFLRDPGHGFEARKRRLQVIDYDDLLLNMRRALLGADGKPDPECPLARELRKTYAAALIDEFQDTDPVQFEIFDTVFHHRDSILFMIGDPKQAIYGFRGGDVYTYYKAAAAIPPDRHYTLTTNYRSAPELVAAVNTLFGYDKAFAEDACRYKPSNSPTELPGKRVLLKNGNPLVNPFTLLWLSGDAEGNPVAKTNVAEAIAKETVCRIAELLADPSYQFRNADGSFFPVTPAEIAVLTDTNDEARDLQDLLRQLRIPSVLYKSGSVFASQQAKEMLILLAAMLTPNDSAQVKAALHTPWCGYSLKSLAETDVSGDLARFTEFKRIWNASGIVPALAALQNAYRSEELASAFPDCERRLTNFRHLTDLLHQGETDSSLSPEALFRWFEGQQRNGSPGDESDEQHLESDRDAVTLITVHKSKGLEFPIVFCPYPSFKFLDPHDKDSFDYHNPTTGVRVQLVQNAPPEPPAAHGGRKKRNAPDETTAAPQEASSLELKKRETLAEHLRLLYVAVTRASNACFALFGNFKTGNHKKTWSAPGYLIAQSREAAGPEEFVRCAPLAGPETPFGATDTIGAIAFDEAHCGARTPPEYRPQAAAAKLDPARTPPDGLHDVLHDNWGMMSFSRMVNHDCRNADAASDEHSPVPNASLPNDPLPHGIPAGLCLHAVLQRLDYTRIKPDWQPTVPDETLFDTEATRVGLYPSGAPNPALRARMADIVRATLNAPVLEEDPAFALSSVRTEDTRREWQFYFRVPESIDLKPFLDIGLTFAPGNSRRKGYMTGSIDLAFRRDGRYYFADWKSNALGADDAYRPEALDRVMTETNYRFQAIIYAVALHLQLKSVLGSSYDFDTNYGGGVYLFIRRLSPSCGAYRFRPTRDQVEDWTARLTGER